MALFVPMNTLLLVVVLALSKIRESAWFYSYLCLSCFKESYLLLIECCYITGIEGVIFTSLLFSLLTYSDCRANILADLNIFSSFLEWWSTYLFIQEFCNWIILDTDVRNIGASSLIINSINNSFEKWISS